MNSKLWTDVRGTVATEFLFAFMPVLLLLLGTLQLVLIAAADLIVRHSAVVGVRSASVVLADDPRHYDDEPEGSIAEGGQRLATIRRAVESPLSAIATPGAEPEDLTLTFPAKPLGESLHRARVPSQSVTLRVTYAFRCRVPLAAPLLCDERDGRRVRILRAEATLPVHRMRSTT